MSSVAAEAVHEQRTGLRARLDSMTTPSGLFLAAVLVIMALPVTRTIQDPDFWWHLRAGQLLIQHGGLLGNDPFTYTVANHHWTMHEWLNEVLFAVEYAIGGLGLIVLILSAVTWFGLMAIVQKARLRNPGRVALGLGISYLMVGFLGGIFNNVSSQLGVAGAIFRFYFHVQPTSIIIAYCLGVLLTFIVVTLSSWRVSRLNIVAAIRDLPEEANAKTRSLPNKIWRWILGPLLILAGIYLWFASWGDGQTNLLMGVTLILAGLMILIGRGLERTVLRQEHIQRLVYTVIGVGLLVIWIAPWNTLLGRSASILDQNSPLFLAAFALRAPLIILGGIMTVMFNADALSWTFTRLVGGIGALTPVLRTAIASSFVTSGCLR